MANRRVLVVEDDRASREAIRRLFLRRGWDVLTAETVAEGLALLDPPPCCVLLDLMLPDGPGESILKKIRDERLPIKVAVCSGVDDTDRLDEVRKLLPEAMLQKPVDARDIFAACGG